MNLDFILEIENKYNLFQDEINGFHYWTFCRSEFVWEIERKKFQLKTGHVSPKEKITTMLYLKLHMMWNALVHSHINYRNNDILVLNHERRVWIDNHYECIYTDSIIRNFENYTVLERPHHQRHYSPVETKHLVYTDWIEVKKTLYYLKERFLHKKEYLQLKAELQKRLEKPLKELFESYEIDCKLDFFVQNALDAYYAYQSKKKSYQKIVSKLHPRLILEVVYYNMDCMIVNEIAKSLGIPTVELQHGAAGREHISYNYAPGCRLEQAPAYYFAFSDFWIEASRVPLPRERQYAMGYPYLERQVARYKGLVTKETGRKVILFLSQGPIGERLSKIALDLRKELDDSEYRIFYKLHPNEYIGWEEQYPYLVDSGIEVIDNNTKNLYEYFAMSDAQVGGFTTTAIHEGLCFGLETYIYDYCVAAETRQLCEKGMAKYFITGKQLADLIKASTGEENGQKREECWKPDALQNITTQIEKMLKETER